MSPVRPTFNHVQNEKGARAPKPVCFFEKKFRGWLLLDVGVFARKRFDNIGGAKRYVLHDGAIEFGSR